MASASATPIGCGTLFTGADPSIVLSIVWTSAWFSVKSDCGPVGIDASATRSAGLSEPTKRAAASNADFAIPGSMLFRSTMNMTSRPPASCALEL